MAKRVNIITLEDAKELANKLDVKAEKARQSGRYYMGASVTIGFSIILFFFQSTVHRETAANTLRELKLIDIIGELVGAGVLRIGMVLIAIFVIQLLVSFARYYFRLSEHIGFSADIVRLCGGNPGLIKEVSTVLLPSFDFGKMPTSPIQSLTRDMVAVVRELAKKIPAR